MTSRPDGNEIQSPSWRLRHLFLGSVLITAGVFVYSAFDYSPDFLEGLAVNALLGIVAFPLIMLVIAALLYGIGRVLGQSRGLVLPCLLLAILLSAYGWFVNRPIARFKSLVLDPPPPSLADLNAAARTSFNDGRAWLFTFQIAPTDFPTLISRLGLQRQTPAVDGATSPAERMRRDFQIDPSSPRDNELYVAPKTLLLASPDHTLIRIYLDRWRDPSP